MNYDVNRDIMFKSGFALIVDLLAQINNLCIMYSREFDKTQQNDDFLLRAYKTSIVTLTFSVIEAYYNFVAQLTLFLNQTNDENITKSLTQVEIDFLLEQTTYIDLKSGQSKTKNATYSGILDKLNVIPRIFARIHSKSFVLDKSNNDWQKLVKLKNIRDEITHVKFDTERVFKFDIGPKSISRLAPYYSITDIDIFNGINAIRKNIDNVNSLIEEVYTTEVLFVGLVDMMFGLVLLNYQKVCGINDEEFDKLVQSKVRLKTEF